MKKKISPGIEKEYSVYKMIKINCKCKKCNKILKFTGWMKWIDGIKHYEHKCPKCKYEFMLMNEYPMIEYPTAFEIENETLKELGLTEFINGELQK